MATTAALSEVIEGRLREIADELAFLPELASTWESEPEVERASWHAEWTELMARLSALAQSHQAGEMTTAQQQAYVALLDQMKQRVELLEQLGLPLPQPSVLERA